jgi:hypothetical protein
LIKVSDFFADLESLFMTVGLFESHLMLLQVDCENLSGYGRSVYHESSGLCALGSDTHQLTATRTRCLACFADKDREFIRISHFQVVPHFNLIQILHALVDLEGLRLSILKKQGSLAMCQVNFLHSGRGTDDIDGVHSSLHARLGSQHV